MMTARENILEAAKKCVNGDRDHKYGNPENNFANIATLWSFYLNTEVSPIDVAMMMALLKIVRAKADPTGLDSYIDLAGYAACAGEIAETSNSTAK
jgi:hypothetical protein